MNITIILEKYCISVEKHEFKLSFFQMTCLSLTLFSPSITLQDVTVVAIQ